MTMIRTLIQQSGQANFRIILRKTGCVVVEQIVGNGVDYGVYLFAHQVGLPYVGQAVDIDRRITQHAGNVARQIARFMPHGAPLREVEQFVLDSVRAALGHNLPGLSGVANKVNPANISTRDFVRNAFKFCK